MALFIRLRLPIARVYPTASLADTLRAASLSLLRCHASRIQTFASEKQQEMFAYKAFERHCPKGQERPQHTRLVAQLAAETAAKPSLRASPALRQRLAGPGAPHHRFCMPCPSLRCTAHYYPRTLWAPIPQGFSAGIRISVSFQFAKPLRSKTMPTLLSPAWSLSLLA